MEFPSDPDCSVHGVLLSETDLQALKTATELLAGIPSVVYGFFGLVVLVPVVRQIGRDLGFGGNGSSMLTASLLLGMMILPTIIGLTESSLRAVRPSTMREQ